MSEKETGGLAMGYQRTWDSSRTFQDKGGINGEKTVSFVLDMLSVISWKDVYFSSKEL